MNPAESLSCLHPPIFMIGRDSRGNWVAQEQSGARGGFFVDRGGAIKFAKSENGNRPHAIVWVRGILELKVGVAAIFDQTRVDNACPRRAA
ncbi:MAG: hypothetical protein WBF58_11385 [Xanthobacteraceae bacterium]